MYLLGTLLIELLPCSKRQKSIGFRPGGLTHICCSDTARKISYHNPHQLFNSLKLYALTQHSGHICLLPTFISPFDQHMYKVNVSVSSKKKQIDLNIRNFFDLLILVGDRF